MALIKCIECGKEFSDRAAACPSCGCPTSESIQNVKEEMGGVAGEGILDKSNDILQNVATAAIDNWTNRNRATSKIGLVKIDTEHRTFQLKGVVPKQKSGMLKKSVKGMLAFSTMGMSLIAEKAVNGAQGSNKWFNYDQLLSYELIEDDSVVTSGGIGQALIGGAVFGGAGAIAGGITGKRTQKKRVESILLKVTLNDFDTPCIMISVLTKPVKAGSKDYIAAMTEAYSIMSALDVITHNK